VGQFEKGNKASAGRPKGSKNKTILSVDWIEADLKEIKLAIMRLVKKDNPTIVGKFIDKLEANKLADSLQTEENPYPEFDDMSEKDLDNYIESNSD